MLVGLFNIDTVYIILVSILFGANVITFIAYLALHWHQVLAKKKGSTAALLMRLDRPIWILAMLTGLTLNVIGSMFYAGVFLINTYPQREFVFYRWLVEYSLGYGLWTSLLLVRTVRLYQRIKASRRGRTSTIVGSEEEHGSEVEVEEQIWSVPYTLVVAWLAYAILGFLSVLVPFVVDVNLEFGQAMVVINAIGRVALLLISIANPMAAVILASMIGRAFLGFSSKEQPFVWMLMLALPIALIDNCIDLFVPTSVGGRLVGVGLHIGMAYVASAVLWTLVLTEQLKSIQRDQRNKAAMGRLQIDNNSSLTRVVDVNQQTLVPAFGLDTTDIVKRPSFLDKLRTFRLRSQKDMEGTKNESDDASNQKSTGDYLERRTRVLKKWSKTREDSERIWKDSPTLSTDDGNAVPEDMDYSINPPIPYITQPSFISYHQPIRLKTESDGSLPNVVANKSILGQLGEIVIEQKPVEYDFQTSFVPSLTGQDRRRLEPGG